ncbi:hypothetical protein [Haloarchaeobius sp. DYHT-AS-18]|uniref:hypothetical protein n=1 Tax=Haloarchaeobius sp. DYHT-AS-18 TaxID=3446117 RepID=UPI003EBD5117
MSNEKKDRFKRVDTAIDQVRKELDEVIDESIEAGGEAREEVREAIDDVQARIVPKSNTPSTRL